jgi:hypothetical protein
MTPPPALLRESEQNRVKAVGSLTVLSPLVLPANLVLLFRGEVVLDIEGLADLLWRLSLDHVCNCLASDIEKGLDVEVVGSL